jgi:general secretion pathway protein G
LFKCREGIIVTARKAHRSYHSGFTIVELLIVIVVIAVLAAISIVAYNGVQERARDSQRKQDVASIVKALELYYIDNGVYPPGSGSTVINQHWSTTADTSWDNLENSLAEYMDTLPRDPEAPSTSPTGGGSDYSYFGFSTGSYCGVANGQAYLLVYHLEGSSQQNKLVGNCTGVAVGPYGSSSNYRVVK